MAGRKPGARPWTPDEEKQLLKMLTARRTAAEIAQTLERSRSAIYARQQLLDKRSRVKPRSKS